MRWIRTNRQLGARLALFALALQLVVSFGHIHAEDLGVAAPANATSIAHNPANDDGSLPPQDGDRHDVCAICVTLSLTSTSLLPIVASLVLPVAYGWEWPADVQTAQVNFDLASHYQARAPPHA
jgi:hypothetical protein